MKAFQVLRTLLNKSHQKTPEIKDSHEHLLSDGKFVLVHWIEYCSELYKHQLKTN